MKHITKRSVSIFCLGLILLLGACAQQGEPQPELGANETVSRALDGVVQPEFDTAPQKDAALHESLSAQALDPNDYEPLPLPERSASEMSTQAATPAGNLVSYDAETGREVKRDAALESLGERPSDESLGGDAAPKLEVPEPTGDLAPQNFGSLKYISNPAASPYRKHVKLFMDFKTKDGNTIGYMCSGTLIDPRWVLTAGHCVHAANDPKLDGWAQKITVIPGYKNGDQPWGSVASSSFYSWTAWTDRGDFKHDIGLVRLSRPIGAITGWHAYGYTTSCSYFTRWTWTNPGYPGGPYGGNYMYDSTGDFDRCPNSLEASFKRLSYGGQSGSGAVKKGVVRAVLSNGNSTWTNDTRLNERKFNDIGTWMSSNTPSSFDAHALDVNAAPSTITAGDKLTKLNYLVHNYSKASRSGRVNATLYLSTNDYISTYDTPIRSGYFTWSFSPKSSVRVNAGLPRIPACTPSGTYYIGVILTDSDGNTSNNASMRADAAPVRVNAPSSCN